MSHDTSVVGKCCSKCGQFKHQQDFSSAPRARDGLHSWCKACLRALAKANYDPQRARERHAAKKADPAYLAMKKAAYERWRQEHPDRVKAAYDRWRAANRQRVAETYRAWAEANPDRIRDLRKAGKARWRARRQGATTERVSYRAILERDGMTCHICDAEIDGPGDLHFDHVLPLSRGGEHSMRNIRPAHALCNLRKGAKIL